MKRNREIISIAAIFVFGWALGGHAQDIGKHDYAALFDEFADEVVIHTANSDGHGLQILEMPGSIHIRRTENTSGVDFVAIDQSEGGAVMCVFAILADIQQKMDNCENIGTPAQVRTSEALINRLGVFIAENSYPSYTVEEFRERWIVQREKYRQIPEQCPEFEADIDRLFSVILSDESAKLLNSILEVPRLPVMNPCL